MDAPLAVLFEGGMEWIKTDYDPSAHPFSFHFFVNDIFMVLFFGIAGKEVSESFLPGGALSSFKQEWTYLLENPEVGDMLKLGALLSFAAGPIAWIMAKMMKIEKIHSDAKVETGH